MTTRPSSKSPTWAETSTYPGGPSIGTATTVEPSAAIKGYGYVPGYKMGARRRNWLDRESSRWAKYHDGIEALNWGPLYEVGISPLRTSIVSVATSSQGETFVAIENEIESTFRGTWWGARTVDSSSGVTLSTIVAVGDVVIAGGNSAIWTLDATAGPGAHFLFQSIDSIAHIFVPLASVAFGGAAYLGGGRSSPKIPQIVKVTTGLVATSVLDPGSLPAGFSPDCQIKLMAASPSVMVAVACDGDTDPAVWTSPDGTTWTLNRPTGTENDFHSLAWNSVDECFEMVSVAGNVYTSANGTTWALRDVLHTGGPTNQPNCVVLAGGLWMCVNTLVEGGPRLSMSLDRGASWQVLHYQHEGSTSSLDANDDGITIHYSGGRFWSFVRPTSASNPFGAIASLRLEV